MVRQAAAWFAAVVIGLILGALSAWGALAFGSGSAVETFGLWSHNRLTGAPAADPYTRAIVAREGLLALSAREALYFNLSRDENGRPLDESCIYELASPRLAARWWSVTLYAADDFLVRNSDHAPSVDATRTLTPAGGNWRARVSPVRGEAANWISSRNAGRGFSLMLRIYNPEQRFSPSEESLPRLSIVSCTGGA
jgi:hypothetical protein